MSEQSHQTILLSVRSPILAPLYLAKLAGSAFKDVQFEYAFQIDDENGLDQNAGLYDPLTRKVLSRNDGDKKYIAGVADPFRSIIVATGFWHTPRILGNVIRHQAFRLASDDVRLGTNCIDALKCCSRVVAQPRYTSGYALMANYLSTDGDSTLTPDDVLFCDTKPGFERLYYRHFERAASRRDPNRPAYAYLTTDPTDHQTPLFDFLETRGSAPNCYHDTLMTALFCGEEWYEKNKGLADGLAEDIQKAIWSIYDDPVAAAIKLKEYPERGEDPFISFATNRMSHEALLEALDRLVSYNAYSPDLKISKSQVERGVALRQPYHKNDLNQVWNYVPTAIRHEPAETLPQQFPIKEPKPEWVKRTEENYRRFVREHYEVAPQFKTGRKLSSRLGVVAIIVSVLLALGASFALIPVSVPWLTYPGYTCLVLAGVSLFLGPFAYYVTTGERTLRWIVAYSAVVVVDIAVISWRVLEYAEAKVAVGDVLGVIGIYLVVTGLMLGGIWRAAGGQIRDLWERAWMSFRERRIKREIRKTPVPALRKSAKPFSQ